MRRIWGTGDRVGGRYVLVDELGAGGMATAWRAWDTTQTRYVCVKLASLGEDVGLRQRWVAESASRISGHHLLEVEDWNSGQLGDYIVMRLMTGGSLDELVDRYGPLPPGQVLEVLRQTATALQTMHRRHLLHRDIKPSNLLLDPTPGGTPLALSVADFGVIAGAVSTGLTAASSGPVGTPGFIPPESFPSRFDGSVAAPGGQGDLYALGVTAYFAATGQLASAVGAGPTPPGWRRYTDPADLELPATWPAALASLIREMLSPDPTDRPRTASALRLRCEELADLRLDLGESFEVPWFLPPLPHGWGRDGLHLPPTEPPTGPRSHTDQGPAPEASSPQASSREASSRGASSREASSASPGRRRSWGTAAAVIGAAAVLGGAALAWSNGYLPSGAGPSGMPSSPAALAPLTSQPPSIADSAATGPAATTREAMARKAGSPTATGAAKWTGSEVHFHHFDVSVLGVTDGGPDRVDVTVRVCITSPSPDAVDGLTRVSWEPWLLSAPGASPRKPVVELAGQPGLLPRSDYHSTGACAEGAIPFQLPEGTTPTKVLYRNGQGDVADFTL